MKDEHHVKMDASELEIEVAEALYECERKIYSYYFAFDEISVFRYNTYITKAKAVIAVIL